MKRAVSALALIFAAAGLGLFAWFVWPTPYAYYIYPAMQLQDTPEFLVRRDRFTGKIELYYMPESKWVAPHPRASQ